jgi:N-acetylglucosaminyldiphosphoundecaprenol N-acetyl-beta-D-mannosaminyltransferase
VIRILDIPLHDSTLQDAVDRVASSCLDGSLTDSHCISATGAHGLVEARRNPAFGQVLKAFAINLPDGMPLVWLGRLKGAHSMQRCYGPDFFRDVLVATAQMPVKHFFCGGKEGIAEELRQTVRDTFHNNNCVGTYCPPFRMMAAQEWEVLTHKISKTKPDIVWIGLSTPKQECFARELSKRIKVSFIITVGAAFDIHTGHLRQAPRFIQRMGLEWLFRLAIEPRRLWRRYLRVVPLFFFYSLVDLLTRNRPANKTAD